MVRKKSRTSSQLKKNVRRAKLPARLRKAAKAVKAAVQTKPEPTVQPSQPKPQRIVPIRLRVLPTPPAPHAKPPEPGSPPASIPAAAGPGRPLAGQPSAGARPFNETAVPPILLEGDWPTAPVVSGPGERFALGPTPAEPETPTPTPAAIEPETPVSEAPRAPAIVSETPLVQILRDLPESYGTERLFLTAQDPHWLYAAWDLAPEQRRRYNALSRDGHLVLRVYVNEVAGSPHSEIQVEPESKSWFIPVSLAGTRYQAELGSYDRQGRWTTIATSAVTLTPPESPSADMAVEFATIPPEVSLTQLFHVVREAVHENVPLLEAVQQLRANGWTELPEIRPSTPPAWTPAQEKALSALVRLDTSRRVWMGSLEITEVIRRHLRGAVSSEAVAAPPPAPAAPEAVGQAGAISSPLGLPGKKAAGERRFWLAINAELVLYGATEPNAKVVVGGRRIRLRPDGTFSYRFALPDGQYPLQVTGTSADGEESRSVHLRFGRRTEVQGEVRAHAQDPTLKPPVESSLL